ncbi:hypothetical protein Pst134EB_025046 [Puccinia striiformis f. sp. tritici]|nr:hypothetical protein Pst134EB_025046 [Puccinia striiformis f. sp. tritici]
MSTASVLSPFQSHPAITQQTDLLIETLLQFGSSKPGILKTDGTQIIELGLEELSVALAKLSNGEGEDQLSDPKLTKLIRSRLYDIHSSLLDGLISLRSWTMTEHVYRKVPCPFPTMARGLFTRENIHPNQLLGQGRHAIVARGYDKFFNIDELPSTKWEALESRSQAPYHLTLKTNGCIIFLAALTPSDLLVTSKHATGGSEHDDPEQPMTHSAAGERWVGRHLAKVGMSSAQLAHELWEANATAVAELTDDDFEEHVIATPADQVGLNLHGVNLNTPELSTYPPEIVAQCAKRWGMHPTPFTTVHNIESVKEHCLKIQASGWVGRQGHVEGVVVRGTPRHQGIIADSNLPTASIFWKVKFEEPYLTYREWRELTRKMLNEMALNRATFEILPCASPGKSLNLSDSEELAKVLKVNVKKIHKPETRLYVHWVIEELLNRPQTFELWQKNRGIVATREAFFEWRKSQPAQQLLHQLGSSHATRSGSQLEEEQNFDKTLLVPIGIPGCGKTTLAVALKNLTTCSHTQSDDITTKKTGPAFIENVKGLLLEKAGPGLVIADKNNHLKTHRAALAELIHKLNEGIHVKKGKGKGSREAELVRMRVRLVAVTWDLESHPSGELQHLAGQRIIQRGANHQSLRPELTSGGLEAHDAILWRFLKTYEEFDPEINSEDQDFRQMIELKFTASIEDSLKELCAKLQAICPGILPAGIDLDDQKIKQAVEFAKSFKPEVKKEMKIEPALQNPRYFGIKLTVNLCELGDKFLRKSMDDTLSPTVGKGREMFDELVKNKRITPTPHLTLVHQNQTEESEEMKRLWDEYQKRVLQRKVNIRLKLGPKLIWNNRVMIVEARVLAESREDSMTDTLTEAGKTRYHVTIGTANESIRPVEGFDLLHCYFGTGKSSPASSSTQPILPTSTPDGAVAVDGGEICSIDVEIACVNGTLKGLT